MLLSGVRWLGVMCFPTLSMAAVYYVDCMGLIVSLLVTVLSLIMLRVLIGIVEDYLVYRSAELK